MIPKLNGPGKDGEMEFVRALGNRPNLDDGLDADGLKAKFDAAAEYIKAYINEKLIPSLLAENIPFASASGNVQGKTVTQALEWLKTQMSQAQLSQIGDNTITAEKLTAEVRALVESNVLVVSNVAPTGENNMAAGNPINQFWVRTENGAYAELFFHVADGVWWSIARQVLTADRGGTGMTKHAAGSMLYGGNNGGFKSLAKPNEQAFLMFEGASPGWTGIESVKNTLGVLNIAAGSYTGTGGNKNGKAEVELQLEDGAAFEPKLIAICCTKPFEDSVKSTGAGGTIVLFQGAKSQTEYESSTSGRTYRLGVELKGTRLLFQNEARSAGAADTDFISHYYNQLDYVYNWFALY